MLACDQSVLHFKEVEYLSKIFTKYGMGRQDVNGAMDFGILYCRAHGGGLVKPDGSSSTSNSLCCPCLSQIVLILVHAGTSRWYSIGRMVVACM